MARPNVESAAAPAVQGTLENQLQLAAALIIAGGAAAAAIYPGMVLGAAGAALWRWMSRPALWMRLVVSVAMLVPFAALRSLLQAGWLFRDMFANALPSVIGVPGFLVWRSVPVEVLAGPILFEAFFLATVIARRSVGGQIRRDHRRDKAQWRAVSGNRGATAHLTAMLSDPHMEPGDVSSEHPAGSIRLGLDGETHQPFDLQLPAELASHVFLPGASNSGKTTTLIRIADGALANWHGLVILDAKGAGLGDTARELAARYDLPFYLVDPEAPDTLGYDICAGNGADVANKLVGAFSYGPSAEIYKNIAMEALPLAVEGMLAAGQDVTLDSLYDAFGPRGFAIIAQKISDGMPETERLRKRLLALAAAGQDNLSTSGRSGLQRRIGALLEGRFGPLFRMDHMLDWDQALSEASVVYIALSALASSEDVELMGRVVAQDLKQVCARRLRAERRGEEIVPVLAMFDEFAALREAEQLTDLLLQARQARMPTVISTQYIPESVPLRKAVLAAGLIICHRVEGGDAEEIANQFGTRKSTELTHQIDFETGYSEKGSTRRVDSYNVSPNILRTLKQGHVVLRSVARNRHAVIHVYQDHD